MAKLSSHYRSRCRFLGRCRRLLSIGALMNASTSSRCFSSTMNGSFTVVFFLSSWVFFVLTLKPIALAVLLRGSS